MNAVTPKESLIARLRQLERTSPTDVVDELLRLGAWDPGSQWHSEQVLTFAARVAASVLEYKLAGLAAYQAQHLHVGAAGQHGTWGLPILPGLEKAARAYNLVRYIPLRSRNVTLRKPCVGDREFLLQLFGDSTFVRQYCRPAQGYHQWIVHSLLESAQRCPQVGDPWAWVVCDRDDKPVGILELSEPDFYQGSVDLSVGLTPAAQGLLGVEVVALGACIAFHHLNLRRITWHVYGDNPSPHGMAARLGMTEEYCLERMLRDAETGEPVTLTIYAMLRDEFRHWPITRRFFSRALPESAPDLLQTDVGTLAQQITDEPTRWNQFPPRSRPYIPAPETPRSAPAPEPAPLPAEIRGKRVRLRPPTPDDQGLLQQWFESESFLHCYPRRLRMTADWEQAKAHIGTAAGGLQFWIVERASAAGGHALPLGVFGLERQGAAPVLFLLAGFTEQAGSASVLEGGLLLEAAMQQNLPDHRLYIKAVSGGACARWLRRRYRACGIERHFRLISREYAELEVFCGHRPLES